MNKRLIGILVFAFVAAIALSAYAEVQNVKVGGDITVLGISRDGFNLAKPKENASILAHIAKVKFDADLTDAVVATMVLRNEGVWGASTRTTTGDADVDLAAAYITLKEFLNEKVTVKAGKMPVKLGSGFIVGDPSTNQTAGGGPFDPGYGDLSSRKSFTGALGIVDLSPFKITAGALKVAEGSTNNTKDDVNAYVLSGAYDTGKKGTVLEATYVGAQIHKGEISNYSGRIVSAPVENLSTSAEVVYQTQKGIRSNDKKASSDTGVLLTGTYGFPEVKMSPTLGLIYLRVSDNWDSMFEDLTAGDIINALLPLTDTQAISASVTAKPIEDVVAKLSYTNARLITAVSALPGWVGDGATPAYTYAMTEKKDLGNELDLDLIYNYTEDVQMGLKLGCFLPGKAFDKDDGCARKSASQVIGSMKVTF